MLVIADEDVPLTPLISGPTNLLSFVNPTIYM